MRIVSKALILSFLMVTVSLAGCTDQTRGMGEDDTDGDGVIDALDLCPDTPPNTFVDDKGCEALCPDFKVWDDHREDFDSFGTSVETDGVSVIVGAAERFYSTGPFGGAAHTGASTWTQGAQNAGGVDHAFVYICGSNGWELQGELVPNIAVQAGDQFGFSVAILGEYAIVGAPNTDVVDSNGNTLNDAGAVYIFARDSSGAWTERVKLIEDTPNANARFGWSVDLGNTEVEAAHSMFDINPSGQYNAVVGAPWSWNDVTEEITGAAYFYTTNSNGNEFAHTIRLEVSDVKYLAASQGMGGFGVDVAIDKTTVVVGSPVEVLPVVPGQYEQGAIYVFDGITMTPGVHAIQETVRINTPDAEWCRWQDNIVQVTLSYGTMSWSTCNNNAWFGQSVDIYADTIVVGAAGPIMWHCWGTIKGINSSVYIFEKTKNGWDENTYVRLTPSINSVHNYPPPKQDFTFDTNAFGREVSIYRDMVLVGSPVRWFGNPGYFLENNYGVPNLGQSDGNAYLFARTAPLTWEEVAIVSIPDIIRAPGYTGWFGQEQGAVYNELAIGGRYVILGSPYDDERPVNWVPFSVPWGYLPGYQPVAGWPAHVASFSQSGQNTGSAYICHYDENNHVYCEWSNDMYLNGSFTWGSYSVANDSPENNSSQNNASQNNATMQLSVNGCPYEDKLVCGVMGYLYDEASAEYWQNWENLPNCTGDSRNYSLNGSDVYFSDYESMLIFSSCLNPMDDTENGTGDNNSNNSNDGGDVVSGCTDPEAENYDPEATRDDGSCTYEGEGESDNSQVS